MARQSNVTITPLPSMIRVDAVGRMEVDYTEVDEAAGEEEGWFNAAEFEESMSTHYGRMVHLDDRTIMFANPEDAAEYLDFDLKPVK
jgi:propane monooxygenase coupling protein